MSSERGWRAAEVQRYPGFRRYLVSDDRESTVVDLVHEPVPQVVPFGFQSPRLQLVDLFFLTRTGIDVRTYLDAARRKDGGMELITLAHVLKGIDPHSRDVLLFDPVSPDQLGAFRDDLIKRLLSTAWPRAGNS